MRFWQHYHQLPQEVRELADKNYELLKANSSHPSLRFKNMDGLWSVRIGIHCRDLARMRSDSLYWFWIGPYSDYDKFLS